MAPQHDEIVKKTEDGFAVAWDTTRSDERLVRAVERVVSAQANELRELFGVDMVVSTDDEVQVIEVKTTASSPRRSTNGTPHDPTQP